MADIAARREARRKRILENSESRLRRINSIQHGQVEVEGSKVNLNSINELPILSNYEPLLNTNNTCVDEENEEIDALLLSRNLRVEPMTTEYPKTTVTDRKIWIIFIIAISTKILSILCTSLTHIHTVNMQCSYVNQIFMPFLLFKVVDLIVIKTSIKENAFLNTLFFLSHVPAKHIQTITRPINIFGAVMQDMFLYFFIFIIAEVCFSVSLSA